VVDNASSDDSVAALRARFPQAHVIVNEGNAGFAAANNQGIAASAGRHVLLLNSDTVARPGSIERLVRFADAQDTIGVVGPQLLNPDGSFQGSFAKLPSFKSELLSVTGIGARVLGPWHPNYGPRHSQAARRAGYVQGACMLVRRAALAQVGLMDEQYFMYSEETDWCLRMGRAGWEVWFTPDAQIVHYGGQSTRQRRTAMLRALYRSKLRFFRKHHGPLAAMILQTLFFLALRCKWLVEALRARRAGGEAGAAISWRDLQRDAATR
jgi:GT2 family glycosyltransferase